MRTKPLNPNSMAMIMENFRRYTDDVENEKDIERMYLLHEGHAPQETTLSELLEKRDRGEIDFVELVDLMEQSMKYEYDQLVQTESKGLTESEIHEIFGQKRQDKWAKIAAGEDEGQPEAGKKGKPTLKYKIREKLLTFTYSKVAAALKSTFGQEKPALAPIDNNLKQAQAAIKGGNTKEALKFLGAGAFKASLKGVKLLFKGVLKIVGAIGWIVGKVAKIMKHPVVRVLLLGAAILALLQVTTVTGGVYTSWKVVNKVATMATGQSLTGRAVGAAGKAAVKGAAGAIGLEEAEQLNEVEDFMTFAEVMGEMGSTEVAAAIIKLGSQLEGQEVMRYAETSLFTMDTPSGEAFEYSEDYYQYSDAALAAEMGAFGNLQAVLSAMQAGQEMPEGGMIPPEVGEAMQKALAAGKVAVENDEAHREGFVELSKTWQLVWDGHMDAEYTDAIQQSSAGVGEWIKNVSTSVGTQAIQKVGDAGVSPTSFQR